LKIFARVRVLFLGGETMITLMKSRWVLALFLVGGIELIVGSANGFEVHGPNWALFLGCGLVGFYVGLAQ
jgi:hypothetical protein